MASCVAARPFAQISPIPKEAILAKFNKASLSIGTEYQKYAVTFQSQVLLPVHKLLQGQLLSSRFQRAVF